MEQKVCLDTDVVIALLNDEERIKNIANYIGNPEVFISSITLFELLLRKTNLDKVESFRSNVKILDIDETVARKASSILKELKERGNILDLKDLFIASTSIINNCTLMTFNKKHFERMKEFGLTLFPE